jgi:hypothetical protein
LLNILNNNTMVKVYFELDNGKYAELVAIFDDEETYDACLPALEKLAKKNNFDLVTESIDEEKTINQLLSKKFAD